MERERNKSRVIDQSLSFLMAVIPVITGVIFISNNFMSLVEDRGRECVTNT